MLNYQSKFIYNYFKDGIQLSKVDRIVYHYTSPEGLLGILTDQKVRFTDIKYMNDRSEGIYFVKLLLEFIEENRGKYVGAERIVNDLLKENDLNEIKGLKATNIRYPSNLGEMGRHARSFLFCTCIEADSLNMWNYYVKNGSYQGYNVGINVGGFLNDLGDMLSINDAASIYYGRVLYTKKQQEEEIENLLETINYYVETRREDDFFLEVYLKRYIELYGVFYKHPKFASEQEFRFVIEFAHGKFDNWINNSKTITENFCIKSGVITPFLSIEFGQRTISRIYISPMTEFEIAKRSIREVMNKKGYKVVHVLPSKIPIRY